MFDFNRILNWKLLAGSHEFPGPDGGTCINEAAIVAAGFAYREIGSVEDCPPCFSRPLAAYALALNDRIQSDEFRRALLMPFVTVATGSQGLAMFDSFYRSGALVFGGGHVVLPLLQAEVVTPGWVSNADFLAGYGMAQAVPGPLFTFAAYLGAVMGPAPNGLAGAAIALIALSLPGLLLVYGMLPFWDALRLRPVAQAAMRGTNAAVVGILGAALYSPVWTSAVLTPRDFAVALAGFLLLTVWKLPPWIVVVLLAATGATLRLI